MTPQTKTLRLLGVVMAVVMFASVAVSGSALADTQTNHQDADVDQAQKSSQANLAHVNCGDQTNKNKQVQAAGVYQNNDQDQEAKDHHKKKDRHEKDKKEDRKDRNTQMNSQNADIDQSQRNAQVNVAGQNNGNQTNKNTQTQSAFIGQNNDQEQD